jgi:hypothetical protein
MTVERRPARRPTGRTVLAVGILALTVAMIVFSLGSVVGPRGDELPNRPWWGVVAAVATVFVSFPLVGAIVALRRPENLIGWLFLLIGLCMTTGFFATEYVWRALITGLPLPAIEIVAWLGEWTFLVAIALAFTWLPLLYPAGRLPTGRVRWLLWLSTAAIGAGIVATAVAPGPLTDYGGLPRPVEAPPAFAGLAQALETTALPMVFAFGLVCCGTLLLRFRRSRSVERQQLKWFLFASGGAFVASLLAVVQVSEPVFLIAMLATACVPASAGIAILRYRLWDIDRLVSRTIGWALVTGTLVGLFGAAVIALQAALDGVTQGETLAVAVSTLLAAGLFQPLRRRVQAVVDRRFDRAAYDARRTADAFGERLRGQVAMDAVADDLRATIDVAVRPASQGLWLRSATNVARTTGP